jgi:hypothetical protein
MSFEIKQEGEKFRLYINGDRRSLHGTRADAERMAAGISRRAALTVKLQDLWHRAADEKAFAAAATAAGVEKADIERFLIAGDI